VCFRDFGNREIKKCRKNVNTERIGIVGNNNLTNNGVMSKIRKMQRMHNAEKKHKFNNLAIDIRCKNW